MEEFTTVFGGLLAFVYHCFDRIVIRRHLPLLTRQENIVHFFRDVHAVRAITKEDPGATDHGVQSVGRGLRQESPHSH